MSKENIGPYRDNGLAVFHKPPRAVQNIKKKLCEKLKGIGLQVTASANTTVVDFLDVTFDLHNKEFKPYSKPGNTQLYVHMESNHPSTVIKRILHSIQSTYP